MAQSRKSLVRERLKLGLKELERGRPAAARQALEQAIAVEPGNAEAHAYLGTALLQLGEVDAAVARLERAASSLGDAAWVVGNLAEAYFRAGRHVDAERSFESAGRLAPGNLSHQVGLANSMAVQRRHDDAARVLESLLRLSPADPLLWYNLGNVRREQRRLDEAVRCFRFALEAQPDWVDARNNLGSSLHGLFRLDEAEREYRACVDADPERAEYHVNLVSVLIDRGCLAEAESVARNLVAKRPGSSMGHAFLAASLAQQGKLSQSLEHDRAAAQLSPDDPECLEKYGLTLCLLGHFDLAWIEFERAGRLRGDSAKAETTYALALRERGRLIDSWKHYTPRVADEEFARRYPGRSRQIKLPDEAALHAGALVTLVTEQGLGDELFYLRFARILTAQSARVHYVPSAKLRSLLDLAEPVATIISSADVDPAVPIMLIDDLPYALHQAGLLFKGGTDASIPAAAYPGALVLQATSDSVTAMRRRLEVCGRPPYIGITWSGGVPPSQQQRDWTLHKTVDSAALGHAMRDLDATLICVQRQPVVADVGRFEEAAQRSVHDFSDLNDTLQDMLALLTLLDEYVGVSNTNVHMRAGAGKRTRVVVPAPPEWRWAGSTAVSPWFPGCVCYRQGLDGDWTAALAALASDLRAAVSNR